MNMEVKRIKIEHEQSAKKQYIAVFVVNLFVLIDGFGCGWVAPSITILTSNESPLPTGPITMDEVSWLTSLWSIGALIGCITFGFITNRFGRKLPLMFMVIPKLLCWLLILLAPNVSYLYAAQLLFGFGLGGTNVMVSLYISEIADDTNRGVLGSTQMMTCTFGFLLALIMGESCDYYTTPRLSLLLLFLFTISFTFFPETPAVLMNQHQFTEAENSIKFYNNLRENDSETLHLKMNKLKSSLHTTDKTDANSFEWSDLVRNPGRKAITIGAVLASLFPLCGCGTITSYAGEIFKAADSTIPSSTSMIVVGVAQFSGTLITTNLVERIGRRFLYIVSTVGTALGLIILGVFLLLKLWKFDVQLFDWLPMGSFSLAIFSSAWAIVSLPFVVINEIMPGQLKDFGTTFSLTLLCVFGFIVPKFFPFLANIIGYHGTMFLFAGFCLFGLVFVILFLPETKGKNREQIMEMLC